MTGKEVVRRARELHGFAYWYGGKGQLATSALAEQLRKDNPGVWTDSYFNTALKDVAAKRRVGDCSYLVCYAYNRSQIGSWAISEEYKIWGDQQNPKDGMILWRPGHVAIYDDGMVLELANQSVDFRIKEYVSLEWSKVLYSSKVDYDFEYEVGWHRDINGWWYAYGNRKGEYYKDSVRGLPDPFGLGYWGNYEFDGAGYLKLGATKKKNGTALYTEFGRYIISENMELVDHPEKKE